MNTAALIVTNLRRFDCGLLTLLRDKLCWLDIHERVMFKPGIMTYLHGQAHRYLVNHLTPASEVAPSLCLHSANRHQLIVPRCRLSTQYLRLSGFSIPGLTVWNSLHDVLRDLQCGYDSYKQFLKTILFSLY